MQVTDVIAIDGLDDAILGTTFRNGREVLAYDYYLCVELLRNQRAPFSEIVRFLEAAATAEASGGLVFVYSKEEKERGVPSETSATLH